MSRCGGGQGRGWGESGADNDFLPDVDRRCGGQVVERQQIFQRDPICERNPVECVTLCDHVNHRTIRVWRAGQDGGSRRAVARGSGNKSGQIGRGWGGACVTRTAGR